MKKNNIFRIGSKVLLAGILVLIAFLTGGLAIGGLVTIATGAVVADGIADVEAVKTGSPDLDKDYVSKLVTQMRHRQHGHQNNHTFQRHRGKWIFLRHP